MPETASLLNVADSTIADLIGDDIFNESLLLNVLFQERILIHEAFLFNSTLLARHLAQTLPGASLFEQAAQKGLVTPAYRQPGCLTAADAYEAMLIQYGRTYPLLHHEMKPFRDRVEASVDRGVKEKKAPFYWPQDVNLGEGYLALLREMLQTDVPPKHVEEDSNRQHHFNTLWQQTKRWRFDLVEEAVARTLNRGQRGVQRTEIYRLLGTAVGIPYDEKSAPSTAHLLGESLDPQRQLAMQVFLKWVTQIHHTNQARVFGTAMNFPAYHLDEDFMMDSLLRSPLDAAPLPTEGFRCEAVLPPLSKLGQVGAARLVGIREDHGGAYLHALARWNRAPGTVNAEFLEQALKDYCAAINQRYNKDGLEPVVADFSTTKSAGRQVVSGASQSLTSSVVAGFIQNGLQMGSEAFVSRSAVATFANLATSGAIALVSFLSNRRKAATDAPRKRVLELTLPVA